MKKIMLLIFIALSLVSCGVNTLKPDELGLGELPKYGQYDLFTRDISILDLRNPGGGDFINQEGGTPLRVTGVVNANIFTDMISYSSSAKLVTFGQTAGMRITNTYSVILVANTAADTTDVIYGVNGEIDNLLLGNSTFEITEATYTIIELDVYKPTYTGNITDADQTDKYSIAGYREGLDPAGADDVETSHVVYLSYANKGSEVFSTAVIDDTIVDANGSISIPLGTDLGPPQIGGGYKIWVLKVYRP